MPLGTIKASCSVALTQFHVTNRNSDVILIMTKGVAC